MKLDINSNEITNLFRRLVNKAVLGNENTTEEEREKLSPHELHIFESGLYGFSLCDESYINLHCSTWFDLLINWMKKY